MSENPKGQVAIQVLFKGEDFAFIPAKICWRDCPHAWPPVPKVLDFFLCSNRPVMFIQAIVKLEGVSKSFGLG